MLFSTHITSDLEKCASHITFIKDGTIQHTGTLADFRQHYDYLRQPGQELTLSLIHIWAQTQSTSSVNLPFRHTDFIFAVIGEELGMLGCVLTLALLAAIVIRCIVCLLYTSLFN